jgi:hypothetical protein
MRHPSPDRPAFGRRVALAVAVVALVCPAARAQLTINPTFDSSITSDPNAATIESTINQVIAEYRAKFSNNVTANITFKKDTTISLGQSNTSFISIPYPSYRSALASHATTANDATALANLPNQANNPVNNTPNMDIATANARALGFSTPPGVDSTISLNTSIMNLSPPPATQNPNHFSLFSAAAHEINEALGFGSNLDFGSNSTSGNVTPQDLFRYGTAAGVRSYTTNPNAQSFFSIDGTAHLARFNQDSSGDFGDWWSPGGQTPQVQDAFATAGASPDLGVELTVLDVIGYTPVPEPGLCLAAGAAGACLLGAFRRSRRRAAAG